MVSSERSGRSWAGALFGLIFTLPALGLFFWAVLPVIQDGWRMQSWSSVQGRVLQAGVRSSYSDGSTSYEAYGRYEYQVAGRRYENNRVAIHEGSDNIGSFQQQLGGRLSRLQSSQQPVTVWFNPDNPEEAIISRDIRWGLLTFKMVFVVVFGGIGLLVLFFSLKKSQKKMDDETQTTERPWLENKDWSENEIRSGARGGMIAIWVFAIIWNALSLPAATMGFEEAWNKEGPVALLILLFPLVGIGMIIWAIKATLEWTRFGKTPLIMDPFPGSVGGDVGGRIKVNTHFDRNIPYKVTLSCIHSYVSGSGKNRSRKESVKWQDEGYARVKARTSGIELQFRFEVPEGLPVSGERSDSYYLWRLQLEADMPGVDLDRQFEIPVYETANRSQDLDFKSTEVTPAGMPKMTAESLLPLSKSGSTRELRYPMLRKPGRSIGLTLFGAVFAGVGVFLWHQAAKEGFMLYVMSSVFSLVGWIIVIFGLYTAFNSLRIRFDGQRLLAQRRWLGIPIKKHDINYHDILDISSSEGMKSSSGNKHSIEYSVIAKLPGDKLTLAEHLDSSTKRDLVVEYFKNEIHGPEVKDKPRSVFEI